MADQITWADTARAYLNALDGTELTALTVATGYTVDEINDLGGLDG